jgi:hypothetical protein
MNDMMKSLRNILGQAMWIALVAFLVTTSVGAAEPTEAEKAAYNQSFDGYCENVEDFLDCRPYQTAGNNPEMESLLLKWGREQGIQGLDGEIPLGQRRKALDSVYRLIMKKYLPDVTVANKAPDVGVKVTVGEPRVVMWAPEGKTSDRAGNIAKLGHLGSNFATEGRWGQYMFPEVNRLRDGRILVRVSVGGDANRNYLNYMSADGGRNWTHFAQYFEGVEMPSRDWSALLLPNGEEIKTGDISNTTDWGEVRISVSDPSIKSYGGYYRLGDLPRELQCVPLFRRKPGADVWVEEKAYLDPDLLVKDCLPNPISASDCRGSAVLPDGSIMSNSLKLHVMSCLRPDGTFDPAYPSKCTKHHFLRSYDGGRTWRVAVDIPGSNFLPFWFTGVKSATVRACINVFPNGNWVAAFRHGGMYWSGGGPLVIRKSSDQGTTWSEPKAIRMPGVNPLGVVLENGIGVFAYQRPGVFLTFCGDGKGDLWGNDVTLVKPWRHARNENSCCNGCFLATGPDRFMFVYTKWDVPDPWGQPRHAVIAQEFIVSKK